MQTHYELYLKCTLQDITGALQDQSYTKYPHHQALIQ
jgi:hypothetical protein